MAEDADESGRQLAEQHGLRFVDLTRSALAPGAASLLPESVARRHHAVPIGRRLGTPVIAVADPGTSLPWTPSGPVWGGSSSPWWRD